MAIKQGRFSLKEIEFVRANYKKLTVEEMALELNRSPDGIRSCMENNGINPDMIDAEKLQNKGFYQHIKEEFSDKELIHFAYQWDAMKQQFGEDVLYTEENQIVDTITLDILISRELKSQRKSEERQKEIIEELKKAVDQNEIESLKAELAGIRLCQRDHLRNYDSLIDKKMKSLERLKATRNQRDIDLSSQKINWQARLKEIIKNEQLRTELGKSLAKKKIAIDKEYERLAELHKFEDDKLDQPLLNSDTVIGEDE